MPWIATAAYLTANFVLYAAVLRQRSTFRTERGIFLYHVASFVLLVLIGAAALAAAPSTENLATLLGSAAAHGIYSLSFLEAWALSDDGYSLQILVELVRRKRATTSDLEQRFADLSAQKKARRINALLKLGLIARTGELFRPTSKGAVAARALSALLGFTRSAKDSP